MLLCPVTGLFAQDQPAAAGLRVSSNFPGGSARVLSIDQGAGIVRITPAGDPQHGWPCWWYLRLDGVNTNQPVLLDVEAGGQLTKLDPNWSLPTRAACSIDGKTWEQTAPGERQGRRCRYRVTTSSSTLWLAWGPPFTLRDADELLQRAARTCPYARPFVLARTRDGRPVPALRVSQPGAAERDRCGVWVLARQHAWECGSSWVSSGLVEWLVSSDPEAVALRQTADLVIVPIMDVDNVERGNGGKKQIPHDQNEDWSPTPFFPEVRAAMEQISLLVSTGRFDVCLDLHNPAAGARDVSIYIPPKPLLDAVRLANEGVFTNLMRAQLSGPLPFTGRVGPCGDTYDPVKDTTTDAWAAHQGGSHVVSLTVETAWNTPASTPAGYREVGERLGRCIEAYLRQRPVRRPPGSDR